MFLSVEPHNTSPKASRSDPATQDCRIIHVKRTVGTCTQDDGNSEISVLKELHADHDKKIFENRSYQSGHCIPHWKRRITLNES